MFLLGASALSASSLYAQGLLSVSPDPEGQVDGSLDVSFSAYLGAGWDDNAGSSAETSDSSFYLQSSLGAEWAHVSRRSSIGLGINGGAYYYIDSPTGIDDDLLYNARLDFRFSHKLGERATIRNYAYVAYEVEPDLAIGETANRRGDQYFYWYNSTNFDYQWTRRLSTRTFLTINGIAYEEDAASAAEDRYTITVGNDFRYTVSDRTTAVLGYAYGMTDYDTATNDAVFHRPYLGVDHRISDNVSSSFRVGATLRDADVTGEQTSPYVSLGLSGNLTKNLRLSWVNRYSQEDSGAGFSDSKAFRTALTANYQATQDLSFYLGLAYIHSDYENVASATAADFSEDAISISTGLNYAISRWVSLTAGYTFYNVDSDLDARGYRRHVLSAGVAASWK